MDFLLLSPIKSLITSLLFLILLVIITHIPALNVVEASYDIKSLNLKEVAFAFLLCGISFWGLFFFNLSLKHTVSGVTITVTAVSYTHLDVYKRQLQHISTPLLKQSKTCHRDQSQ